MIRWLVLPLLLSVASCGGIIEDERGVPRGVGGASPGGVGVGFDPGSGGRLGGIDAPPPPLPIDPNIRLFSPDESPFGLTHPEWLAAYWQWFLSVPLSVHPRAGGSCAEGQSGTAWFLATGTNGDVVERDCTIPQDRPVFFVLNSRLLHPTADCSFCTAESDSPLAWYSGLETGLSQAGADLSMNTAFLELDGTPITVGTEYFWSTPDPFFVSDVPQLDPYFGCTGPMQSAACGWTAGSARPFASVGFAVMLHPLPPGDHVIRFGAKKADGTWLTDVTYSITVD